MQRAPDTTRVATAESLPAFFMGVAWDALLDGNVRTLIERESLAPFLRRQRWFGGKARPLKSARFVDWGVLRKGPQPVFLTIVQADYQDGGREQYFVPLSAVGGADADAILARAPELALARLTGARKGAIVDGAADDRVPLALLDMLDRQETLRTKRAVARAKRTPAFDAVRGQGALAPRRGTGEQSNTSVILGDRVILKLLRRIEPGPNPDVEIGQQLTSRTSFRRAPRVAGALEYEPAGEPVGHLFVAHEFVTSQADGWRHALAELKRFYDEVQHRGEPAPELVPSVRISRADGATPHAMCELAGAYIDSAQLLGRRTGELHVALASDVTRAGVHAGAIHEGRRDEADRRDDVGAAARAGHDPAGRRATARRALDGDARRAAGGRAQSGVREDPHSRRLPPRAGAVGRIRLLPPRLRGRARAAARRAAARNSRR